MKPDNIQRIYRAIIVTNESPEKGINVEIQATSLDDAEKQLEEKYGIGSVYSLYNEEDANKPR